MINKHRVKRIKSVIYAVIVVLVFLPLILLIALCISMMGFLRETAGSLDRIETYIVQEPAPSLSIQEPVESSTLEPEGQAATPEELEPRSLDVSQPDPETEEVSPEDNAAAIAAAPNPYQPDTYPEVYFSTLASADSLEPDTLYLTFDNTPSSNFNDIVKVLDKHNVKATFFVWWGDTGGAPSVGSDFRALIDAGHSIGIHSGDPSLPLSGLYSSADAYMEDFSAIFSKIESETGIRTRLYRLPGGSVNPANPQRQAVLREIKTELDARGFLQYDWNASAQDAVNPPLSMQQILTNLNTSVEKGERVVVLLHDGTSSVTTAQALDQFIPQCLEEGYTFKALDYDIEPVSFLK